MKYHIKLHTDNNITLHYITLTRWADVVTVISGRGMFGGGQISDHGRDRCVLSILIPRLGARMGFRDTGTIESCMIARGGGGGAEIFTIDATDGFVA